VEGEYASMSRAQSWLESAACRGVPDPDLFFPSDHRHPAQTLEAKQVCARCPVVQPCLREALEHGIGHGVWGGLSSPERHGLQSEPDSGGSVDPAAGHRERRAAAPDAPQ
jgi:WhiB family transcriptional regulator, redox-sensing transcriptional regulator